ncbi:nitroreductase family protein [Virgibacillus necropolis]|uniref:Nitroreductase n=1 Tax=Virgibacillus necropolis TaxID=163877 RepID=A0A221MEA5_9BACI|nr:nitroreductase family protein [Virgibacillus necropolis]ASN05964.1 nitroreductase [Virgibacillus necropolis]
MQSRRTILDYKPDKIERHTLLELFRLASYAPNHHMKEPWMIKLYEDEARSSFGEKIVDSYIRLGLLKTLDEKKLQKARVSYDKFFRSVPHHALFYMEKEDGGGYIDDENYAAVCAFIQNFQLAAWNLGIGTMWTAKETLLDKVFIRDIGLSPDTHKLIAVVQIGYPNKVPKAKNRTSIQNAIEWINN